MWKTYLRLIYYYCGLLDFPVNYKEVDSLESILRNWVNKIPVVKDMHLLGQTKDFGNLIGREKDGMLLFSQLL